MQRSSFGKKISYAGEVCPHCQQDKRSQQQFRTGALHFAHQFIGGVIGGFIGAVASMLAGKVTASAVDSWIFQNTSSSARTSKPSAPGRSGTDAKSRLLALEKRKSSGLVSATEYADKRKAILNSSLIPDGSDLQPEPGELEQRTR